MLRDGSGPPFPTTTRKFSLFFEEILDQEGRLSFAGTDAKIDAKIDAKMFAWKEFDRQPLDNNR